MPRASLAMDLVLLYAVIGASVGLAAAIAAVRRSEVGSGAVFAGAIAAAVFWPLFLPFFLAPSPGCDKAPIAAPRPGSPPPASRDDPRGRLARELRATERKLEAALAGLEGRDAVALAPVLTRLPDVIRILDAQAKGVDELDRVIAGAAPAPPGMDEDELARDLRRAREESDRRLGRLRDRRRAEILRALVRLEELVGMVQLARFSREPAGGAGALVQQIAATVEALTELSAEESGGPAA